MKARKAKYSGKIALEIADFFQSWENKSLGGSET
jgi:hypothetical protein